MIYTGKSVRENSVFFILAAKETQEIARRRIAHVFGSCNTDISLSERSTQVRKINVSNLKPIDWLRHQYEANEATRNLLLNNGTRDFSNLASMRVSIRSLPAFLGLIGIDQDS